VLAPSLALIVGLPLAAFVVTGLPLGIDFPALKGFNFSGGLVIQPELMALLLGLSIYTASYIAEIVRGGILGIARGQREAALALGLTNAQTLRLVIIPQALRLIIPPLTSQYLNLTKNSSLAVAIGYPDFVSVFTGTVLNQTGQAIEVILMTMGVFLTISLLTSAGMNWFNRRAALVER
jgi:general L-amino acid transport system permease protein